MRYKWKRSLFACVFVFLLAPSVVATQERARVVRGTVRDTAGRPLEAVEIRSPDASARTDADGHFQLRTRTDPTRVVLRKLGFEPTLAVLHDAADTMATSIMLLPLIARLDRVVVKGVPYDRSLYERGFYRRQRGNRGYYFDPDDVRLLVNGSINPLLQSIPRVEVSRQGTQDVAIGYAGGQGCRMHVYIDRAYQYQAMSRGGGFSGLRDLIDPAMIYAVEVYPTPLSVPPEFARGASTTNATQIPSPNQVMRSRPPTDDANAPCGAIVIWTKQFAPAADSTSRQP